jgi:hypothetical protein
LRERQTEPDDTSCPWPFIPLNLQLADHSEIGRDACGN